MQRSIFKRYMGITMVIVFLSFTLLGGVMMVFFSQYWRQEKKELLSQNANSISGIACRYLNEKSPGKYELQADTLQDFIASFSTSIDADIFITDLDGRLLLGNFANSKSAPLQTVPAFFVDAAAQGLFEGRGDMGGLYSDSYYIIGVPMLAQEGGPCVGTVFAATSPASMSAMQMEAFKIFLLAAVAALAVSFCVVGAFAFRLAQPLRQMSAAARSLGAGDFSVRVPVRSADEVGQLADSFNHMADSLSNSEGMRRSFIANVSHELKTPMTTIAGFIDGILDGTIPASEQGKYLGIVSDEVKRLSRLVKSMLDLSRIDSGDMKIHPATFDITHTLVATLLTFEQSIDEKSIEIVGLEEATPMPVYGDQDLLHQVVYNLVENAVKFTNQGGSIRVMAVDSVDRTTVLIENTGPGIAPEDLPMVFDRFYKGDKSRSRDKNGMGLGLYLVRTILQLHGGNIQVTSVQGQFCRFEFYLPRPPAAPRLKEAAPKPKEGQPRLKPPRKSARPQGAEKPNPPEGPAEDPPRRAAWRRKAKGPQGPAPAEDPAPADDNPEKGRNLDDE
ncbi:ATP-binding protein [Acutalibacter caecimuris]|uniref:ATP-binding protein n=1 Tax=Acutalibacter caecimuris TaxID=3093657 RepID=UPI002AC9EA4E|nr:ATP-binding protein [Acutalibacter sp. M00118]